MICDAEAYAPYIQLLKDEVKPALGCTEPIAVALAVAKSTEELRKLGEKPAKIIVDVSANILKNAIGVGIPGTNKQGLYIASALGAICGDSSLGLEVLQKVDDNFVELAEQMVCEGRVEIRLASAPEKLYIKANCWSTHHSSTCTIVDCHDRIVEVTADCKCVFAVDEESNVSSTEEESEVRTHAFSVESIYKFATEARLEDIEFILGTVDLNNAIAQEGLSNPYGLQVGRTIMKRKHVSLMGDSVLTYAMSLTAAATDARMGGCVMPAMSNSGSGNQGIMATLPVYAVADRLKSEKEKLVRALVISHLVAIHIKTYLGKLSALCGCVIASAGSSCGIVYLQGGGYKEITYAIKNMIGNITGMVCDGAKAGCALKVSSATSSAIQSAILAIDDVCVSSNDGIIENDIEKSILNLAEIGTVGMQRTDEIMLQIMLNKN